MKARNMTDTGVAYIDMQAIHLVCAVACTAMAAMKQRQDSSSSKGSQSSVCSRLAAVAATGGQTVLQPQQSPAM